MVTERGALPLGLTFRQGAGGTVTISGTVLASALGNRYVIGLKASSRAGRPARQRLIIKIR